MEAKYLFRFAHLVSGGAMMSGFLVILNLKFSILAHYSLLPLNGIIIESSTQSGPICIWPALEAV